MSIKDMFTFCRDKRPGFLLVLNKSPRSCLNVPERTVWAAATSHQLTPIYNKVPSDNWTVMRSGSWEKAEEGTGTGGVQCRLSCDSKHLNGFHVIKRGHFYAFHLEKKCTFLTKLWKIWPILFVYSWFGVIFSHLFYYILRCFVFYYLASKSSDIQRMSTALHSTLLFPLRNIWMDLMLVEWLCVLGADWNPPVCTPAPGWSDWPTNGA